MSVEDINISDLMDELLASHSKLQEEFVTCLLDKTIAREEAMLIPPRSTHLAC
jgi:hypothetical protein